MSPWSFVVLRSYCYSIGVTWYQSGQHSRESVTTWVTCVNRDGNNGPNDSTIQNASWTRELQIVKEHDLECIRKRGLMGGSDSKRYNVTETKHTANCFRQLSFIKHGNDEAGNGGNGRTWRCQQQHHVTDTSWMKASEGRKQEQWASSYYR